MGCISVKQKVREKDLLDLLHDCETAHSYIEVIRPAIVAGEIEVTLRALHKCDSEKKYDISEKYASSFQRDLVEDMAALSWKAGFITEMFLADRFVNAARHLFYCLQNGIWKQNMAVVEIIFSHNVEELESIQKLYQENNGHSLVTDLQTIYNDEQVCRILVERLSLKIVKTSDDVEEDISVCSRQLVDAARNGTLFSDSSLFQECITSKSALQLWKILDMFLKQCQRDMAVEIEKYYPAGHTREALVAIVKLLHSRWLYLAHVIHNLLEAETEIEERRLLYLILIMDQDSMRELKRVYQNTYFEMMSQDINALVKDPITQRTLLNHIK